MGVDLRYILQFDLFKNIRLIAGAEGLEHTISGCGILDYELDRSLNGKYSYSNFSSDQLVLTSFLFARDDPFLVDEAIKHLISLNGCGLAIRNIYRLPIHDYILRYADTKKFPIFLIEDKKLFFEDIILQVDRCIRFAERGGLVEERLNCLLYESLDPAEAGRIVAQVFPAVNSSYYLAFFRNRRELSEQTRQQVLRCFDHPAAEGGTQAVLPYGNGFFFFRSRENLPDPGSDGSFTQSIAQVRELLPELCVGLSNVHHYAEEMEQALREAMSAAAIHAMRRGESDLDAPFLPYRDIGIYRALLPVARDAALQNYSRMVLEPLIGFDAENRSALLDTVLDLVRCGGDLHLLSKRRGEHENTLRNRLDKVHTLTGLNYRKPAQYEELALAAQVLMLGRSEHYFSML